MKVGQYKIVVIGDIMLDQYIVGTNTRKSPEADVPIIKINHNQNKLGGAANVAYNLTQLGSEAILFCITGVDQSALLLEKLLEEAQIESHIIKDSKRCTTVKTRVINDSYDQFIRLDTENNHLIDQKTEDTIIQKIDDYLSCNDIDAIILQDYNKGLMTENLIHFVHKIVKVKNIPLFVDPKHQNFHLLSNCTVFKPNFTEFATYYKGIKTEKSKSDIQNAIISSPLRSENIFVTLAESGIFYKSNKKVGIIDGENINNPDVSGAGDTVISVITILTLMGLDIEIVAKCSNLAGAIVCKKRGISSIFIDELKEILNKTK